MPNHLHGILMIVGATPASPCTSAIPRGPASRSISAVVGSFKSSVTRRINTLRNTPGAPVWQRNFYDRVVRSESELTRIREYIATNPARWMDDPENPGNHA